MSFDSVGLTNVLLAIIAIVNLVVLFMVYKQQSKS
jgi:hypothetical protein